MQRNLESTSSKLGNSVPMSLQIKSTYSLSPILNTLQQTIANFIIYQSIYQSTLNVRNMNPGKKKKSYMIVVIIVMKEH